MLDSEWEDVQVSVSAKISRCLEIINSQIDADFLLIDRAFQRPTRTRRLVVVVAFLIGIILPICLVCVT